LPPTAADAALHHAMDPDPLEPLAALLTFLALTAAAHPAAARLDDLAAASPSHFATGLSFAFRVTALTAALAGMHRVRSTATAAGRWRRFRRWAATVGSDETLGKAVGAPDHSRYAVDGIRTRG
jgi:hypothetical protein